MARTKDLYPEPYCRLDGCRSRVNLQLRRIPTANPQTGGTYTQLMMVCGPCATMFAEPHDIEQGWVTA